MEYREYSPLPRLAPFVDRLWTLTGRAVESEGAQPILPDGRPELVVHFGDRFDRIDASGSASRQAAVLFAGQLTEQLTIKPTGVVAVVGIRFHPFGAAAIMRTPQHELTGLTIGLEDVAPGLAREIARVHESTADVRLAVPLLQAALARCASEQTVDRRIDAATRAIVESGGAVSIDQLAGQVAMTRRHLERCFLASVGISPKRLARINRFQKALRVLEGVDSRRRGAVTAATCGYADQSHFIREFRQLAGCSPAEHLLAQGELTGFFVNGDRTPSHLR